MKVNNKTTYTTRSLKKLFMRCLQEHEKTEGKFIAWQRDLHVTVKYKRQDRGCGGRAFVNGKRVTMLLPRRNIETESVAFVFLHELMHIRGHQHRTIYDNTLREQAKTFAHLFTIDVKEKKEKQAVNLVNQRYEHVLSMVEKKEKAIKRLQNQLKKWVTKKKYYERALANKKENV